MQEDEARGRDRRDPIDAVAAYGPHESTGYWVRLLANSMREYFTRRLAEHGLTFALWPVLGAVHGGNATTPSEVAKYLGLDRSAVTRQLDRLEKNGLLARLPSGSDRRSVSLELTEKGRDLVPQLAALSRETNEHFLRNLTADEAKAFHDIIRKMLRNADGPIKGL